MAQLEVNKNIELKTSWDWIKLSFNTFRERPLQFIILGIFSTLLGWLPLFGAFIFPLFIARFAELSEKADRNEKIKLASLFENLFTNSQLIRLAFINFCLNTLIFVGQYLVENNKHLIGNSFIQSEIMFLFLIPLLILQMAMWLSPVICLYNDLTPKHAMWLSIKAAFTNILTLIIYSIIIITLTILAILPIGLGLIIWLPILNITSYHIYRSMFKPIGIDKN